MKYYGGNVPQSPDYIATTHDEHARAWAFREQLAAQRAVLPVETLPQDLIDKLTDELPDDLPEYPMPQPYELVSQIPDVVFWCRARMNEREQQSNDEATASGVPGSKPPFRIGFMAAADREFAALAHWAAIVGIHPTGPVWRVPDSEGRLRIAGMASDSFYALYELTEQFWQWLIGEENEWPVGLMDDPRWGLWKIRQQHYANWPQLQTLFMRAAPMAERTPEPLQQEMLL